MSTETETWCRNIKSGAILKLAQIYQQQSQLTKALALCIKTAYISCPDDTGQNCYSVFKGLIYFAIGSLLEALGEDQYCQIYRAVKDYPVSTEEQTRELNLVRQWQEMSPITWRHTLDFQQTNPEIAALLESAMKVGSLGVPTNNENTNKFDPLEETAVASLPDPDPECQQLSQIFLQSVYHNLASGSVSQPHWPLIEASYSAVFSHLNLPPGYIYLFPSFISHFRAQEVEEQEKTLALQEINYYAFYRYLRTLRNHTNKVYTVAFSSDSRRLASGSADTTVKLWDSENKQELHTLAGHTDSVLSVAFSPDGLMLASGSADRTIKLWNVQTGQELQTLTGHTDSVLSVAFSPDGQMLASGSADRTIKLWNAPTGREISTLIGHTHSVLSVVFSPDGRILASGSADATIKLWELETRQELHTLAQNFDCVYSISFHPQGQTLFSAHRDWSINIWDLNTRELIRTISLETDIVSIAVSPDGQAIAAGGGGPNTNNVIWIWNCNTGKVISTFSRSNYFIAHRDLVYAVAFSPDRSMLASAGKDGDVKLWGIPKPINLGSDKYQNKKSG